MVMSDCMQPSRSLSAFLYAARKSDMSETLRVIRLIASHSVKYRTLSCCCAPSPPMMLSMAMSNSFFETCSVVSSCPEMTRNVWYTLCRVKCTKECSKCRFLVPVTFLSASNNRSIIWPRSELNFFCSINMLVIDTALS